MHMARPTGKHPTGDSSGSEEDSPGTPESYPSRFMSRNQRKN